MRSTALDRSVRSIRIGISCYFHCDHNPLTGARANTKSIPKNAILSKYLWIFSISSIEMHYEAIIVKWLNLWCMFIESTRRWRRFWLVKRWLDRCQKFLFVFTLNIQQRDDYLLERALSNGLKEEVFVFQFRAGKLVDPADRGVSERRCVGFWLMPH